MNTFPIIIDYSNAMVDGSYLYLNHSNDHVFHVTHISSLNQRAMTDLWCAIVVTGGILQSGSSGSRRSTRPFAFVFFYLNTIWKKQLNGIMLREHSRYLKLLSNSTMYE